MPSSIRNSSYIVYKTCVKTTMWSGLLTYFLIFRFTNICILMFSKIIFHHLFIFIIPTTFCIIWFEIKLYLWWHEIEIDISVCYFFIFSGTRAIRASNKKMHGWEMKFFHLSGTWAKSFQVFFIYKFHLQLFSSAVFFRNKS